MNKIRQAFRRQRQRSAQRGVQFLFSYEEWVSWWASNLGLHWFDLRSKSTNPYVMARFNDEGPYAPHNVKCVTQKVNRDEQRPPTPGIKNPGAKLTNEEVLCIKQSKEPTRLLMAKFGIKSRNTINRIRAGSGWKHL